MWACDIHALSSSAHGAFQVGRVHGIASLSQDPTSSRLIASCTDNKWVTLPTTMVGIWSYQADEASKVIYSSWGWAGCEWFRVAGG